MAEFEIKPSGESVKSVAELRKELKALKDVQAQTVAGSKEWTEAAARIGEIKEEFAGANEQAKIFAAGTSFEKSQNAIKGLKQGITELDFGKAAESAAALNTIIASFSVDEVREGIINLGSTVASLGQTAITAFSKIGEGFMSMIPSMEQNREMWGNIGTAITKNFGSIEGFGGMVKNLGKSFVSGFASMAKAITSFGAAALKVGLQLLTNPIFLLATAIVLIVVAIVALMNKFGILKKVLEITMAPLNLLIEGLKALGDFLGFTSYAADEAAEAQKVASEKRIKALESELNAAKKVYEVTKGLGEQDLADFEMVTGKKAVSYAEMVNMERELADEKILQAQRATAAALEEYDEDSEEYKKAQEEETKALEARAEIEERILFERFKLYDSVEANLQRLRAGAITNEKDRAKAMVDIAEGEALAKLQAAKREAQSQMELAKTPEAELIAQRTLENIEESITLTKAEFQKQRAEIDKKASAAARDAAKKASDDAKRRDEEAIKKAQEKAKKEIEIVQKATAAKLAALGEEKKLTQEYLDIQVAGLEEENRIVENNSKQKNNKLRITEDEKRIIIEGNNQKIRDLTKAFNDEQTRLANEAALSQAQIAIDEAKTFEEKINARIDLIKAEATIALQNDKLTADQRRVIENKLTADTKALQAERVADAAEAAQAQAALDIETAELAVSAQDAELAAFKGSTDQRKQLIQELYDLQIDLIEKRKAAEIQALTDEVTALQTRAAAGEALTAQELQKVESFQQAKKNIEDTYAAEADAANIARDEAQKEADEAKLQKALEDVAEYADMAAQSIAFLSQLQSERFAKEQKEMDAKNAKELSGYKQGTAEYAAAVKRQQAASEELAKKQFAAQKKMQLAAAIVDGAKAITASLASAPIAIGAVPNPAGIFSLAFATATAAANIAKIASSQYESAGGSAPETGAPSIPEGGTPGGDTASPNINLFGQGNNANTEQFGSGGTQGTPTINVVATVSETEITATQQRVAQMNKNAEL